MKKIMTRMQQINRRIRRVSCGTVLLWTLMSHPANGYSAEGDPQLTAGLNSAQLVWNSVAGALFDVTWISLPLEASYRLSDHWGVSAGIHYRYEDYWEGTGVWNDYHEVFIMGGPRYSISGRGLAGWFVNAQLGIGYARDPSPYSCVSLVFQPELGYALVWGAPGFSLSFGLGLLMNIPLSEDPSLSLTTVGYLAHRFIPLVDLKIGFSI